VAREVPVARLEAGEELSAGVPLGPVLQRAGLASSQSDARRQLEQGGVSVNGDHAAADRLLEGSDVLHERWVLLRKGKKGWAVVDLHPES
jgi:tyrosyl-tRNA synthetase